MTTPYDIEQRRLAHNAYKRQRYAEGKDRKASKDVPQSVYIRNWRLKKLYGLTLADYDALLAAQGGCCAVCKTAEIGRKGKAAAFWPVDHDHKTGQVRGLLCHPCNVVLGLVDDDQERLLALVEYLRGAQR